MWDAMLKDIAEFEHHFSALPPYETHIVGSLSLFIRANKQTRLS